MHGTLIIIHSFSYYFIKFLQFFCKKKGFRTWGGDDHDTFGFASRAQSWMALTSGAGCSRSASIA